MTRRGGAGGPDERLAPPLRLASGHLGVGHGGDAHAPDEDLVIEPANSKVKGYDDAERSFVDQLYALAR